MGEQAVRIRNSRIVALGAIALSLVSAALFQAGAGAMDPHEGPLWLAFFCLLWPILLSPFFCLCALIMLFVEQQQSVRSRVATLAIAVVAAILPWLPQIVALKLWLGPQRALRDSSALVRRHGVERLREQSGPTVVAALVGALRDPDDDVRLNAAVGLWERGPDAATAVPALLDALDDSVPGVRGWAMAELARIPGTGPLAVPRLIRAMERKEDRRNAMDALFRFGPEAAPAVPALRGALPDPERSVRRRAARAIGGVGPTARPAVPELRVLLSDESLAVRETARAALVALGETEDLPPSVIDRWPKRTFSPQAWQATPYWIDSKTTPEGQRYVFCRDLLEKRLLDGKHASEIVSLLGPPHTRDRYRLLYSLKTSWTDSDATWWLEIPLDPNRKALAVSIHAE